MESVGVFKPDPRVYRLATRQFGCAPERGGVSSPAMPGTRRRRVAFGMQVVRVNRAGAPDEYGLAEAGRASLLGDLAACRPAVVTPAARIAARST